jgi:hypothetical protein
MAGRVRGSGNIITKRNESGFNQLCIGISMLYKTRPTTSVKVEADDNIVEYIEVHTDGSTLEIYTEGHIRLRPTHKIKVYVSNREYKELQVSGASSIRSENEITSPDALHVDISGASEGRLEVNAPKVSVNLTGKQSNIKGKTKDFEGGASGASEIRCFDLLSENAEVDAVGQ